MDKCPTCEREFKQLKDYPIVFIESFERVELPETSEKKHWDKFKEDLEIEEIQHALSTLESLVGKEVQTSELLEHVRYSSDTRRNITLDLAEQNSETEYRTCHLNLNEITFGPIPNYHFVETLGIIRYEGRLRD